MIGRIVIAEVRPSTPSGHPAKAVVGEVVPVSADIFRDGHDILAARVRWRATDKDGGWAEAAPAPRGRGGARSRPSRPTSSAMVTTSSRPGCGGGRPTRTENGPSHP